MKRLLALLVISLFALSFAAYAQPVRKGRLPEGYNLDSLSLRPLVECTVRDGLPNFFKKIKSGQKEINIVYFGGSITDQDGYRVKSCEYLQSLYPDVRFNGIKSSIGGTGSYLGALRCGHDVIAHNPDLVVVEYAVNDDWDSSKGVMRGIEGIVRQIWKANTETDILFVYTITHGTPLDQAKKGLMTRAASADEEIADYYGIPSIHMGVEVARLETEGKLVMIGAQVGDKMVFSPDGVHPYVDTGHELYTQALIRSFPKLEKKHGVRKHKLYAPVSDKCIDEVTTVDPDDPRIGKSGDIRKYEGGRPDIDWFMRLTDLHILAPGSEMTFKFKGSEVILYDILGPEGVILDVSIDGRAPVEEVRFDPYCSYFRLNNCTAVGKADPDKIHTVTIRVTDKPIDKRGRLNEDAKAEYDRHPERFVPQRYYLGKIFILGELVGDEPKE